eukprot:237918-Amorphochlora_amoeboformis.AAC.1
MRAFVSAIPDVVLARLLFIEQLVATFSDSRAFFSLRSSRSALKAERRHTFEQKAESLYMKTAWSAGICFEQNLQGGLSRIKEGWESSERTSCGR